jgi:hypothetical protein
VDTQLFMKQPKPLVMSPFTTAATPAIMKARGCRAQQLRHPQQQPAEHQSAQQAEGQVCGDAAGDSSSRSIGYWLHAERLMQVSPGAWQQHLAQKLLGSRGSDADSNGSNASGNGSSGGAEQDLERVRLLAGVACDWCCRALPEGPAGRQRGPFGCPSCGAAQYCSRVCAEVAKKVHNANCW